MAEELREKNLLTQMKHMDVWGGGVMVAAKEE